MIKDKNDYMYYRKCDKEALDIKRKFPRIIGDEIWKFEILMRKYEYYSNCKRGIGSKIISEWLHFRYKRKSLKYGVNFVTGDVLSVSVLYSDCYARAVRSF